MWYLLGLALLCAEPAEIGADEKPQPKLRIDVRIVEFKPIEGITRQDPNSQDHLHIEPALVVTPADVASIHKRGLRGPTIGSNETGFQHYPRLVVNIQLTEQAKRRLKAAVLKSRPTTTTKHPILATVVNNKHDGSWTKYILDDPTSSVHWSNFGPSIGCTFDKKLADRLVEYLAPPEEDQ